ncbi:amino acid ABC transporter ATP-binding protein [Hathewaya massiliensis]|uniref:amino acid ABC transporter ATP-binding protein n=1 Tax=Hathewaya massiliensis TaxID=1964382 RepID=UPI00163BE11C|nr:amino acid ABC transporter ATP-binding protein [Hathewaya massiliensis]
MLRLENINKYYNKDLALKDINISIEEGDIVSIIGPSGSGKSTLLRSIIGLEEISSGKILKDSTIEMGMVFQSFNLFPHKTVLENVIIGPMLNKKIKKEEAIKIGEKFLERVGLLGKKNDYPGNLSGGQKQRVAIARALAMKPKIILFDEPTSALDPELVGEVLKVIRELKEDKITMIIVTHEISFARDISSKIIFMEKGKILLNDYVEEVFNNKNTRIQEFLQGAM